MNRTTSVSWPLRILCFVIALWLVGPMFIVIPLSFTGQDSFTFPPQSWSLDYYRNFFTDPAWTDALWTSVRLGIAVTIAATAIGTAAAIALVRGRMRGKTIVTGALMAPMLLPQIIVALAIYIAFLRLGLVGTYTGFFLAHTALAIPFVLVPVMASLRTLDPDVEHAAAGLGAPPASVLWYITARLAAPGILSGAVFAFATSFDEVVISIYLQSPLLRTLPVQMYTSVTTNTDPTIAAASAIILTVTTLLILVPQLVSGRVVKD
jgi:putative spermidine/putrescine transport system permease protein